MKRLILLAAISAAACAKPMSYVSYRPASGEFSVEVPASWTIDERGPFSRKPIGEVRWVGKIVDQNEGWPVGALLFVRRLDRQPDKSQERYRQGSLAETDALFAGKQPADVSLKNGDVGGHPARWYQRDYDESAGGGIHGAAKGYPSRVTGVAIQTPDAYYVLEYRATRELFERFAPAFERMASSFKLK